MWRTSIFAWFVAYLSFAAIPVSCSGQAPENDLLDILHDDLDLESLADLITVSNRHMYGDMETEIERNKAEIERLQEFIDKSKQENYELKAQIQDLERGTEVSDVIAGTRSHSAYSCEREEVVLSCPEDRTIFVTSAYYGQYSSLLPCEDELCCMPHPTMDCVESVEQYAPQDWLALQASCNGETNCTFSVPSGSVFTCEEPYYLEYMTVYYTCTPVPTDEPVGFTAFSSEIRSYTLLDVIIFDSVQSNIGGYYQKTTSAFVCPYSGLYVFAASVTGNYSTLNVDIMREEEALITARCHADHIDQGSSVVVTECAADQRVWVRADNAGTLLGGPQNKYTSFSGFLLNLY